MYDQLFETDEENIDGMEQFLVYCVLLDVGDKYDHGNDKASISNHIRSSLSTILYKNNNELDGQSWTDHGAHNQFRW